MIICGCPALKSQVEVTPGMGGEKPKERVSGRDLWCSRFRIPRRCVRIAIKAHGRGAGAQLYLLNPSQGKAEIPTREAPSVPSAPTLLACTDSTGVVHRFLGRKEYLSLKRVCFLSNWKWKKCQWNPKYCDCKWITKKPPGFAYQMYFSWDTSLSLPWGSCFRVVIIIITSCYKVYCYQRGCIDAIKQNFAFWGTNLTALPTPGHMY